jgi:hypothetical protein
MNHEIGSAGHAGHRGLLIFDGKALAITHNPQDGKMENCSAPYWQEHCHIDTGITDAGRVRQRIQRRARIRT